MTHKPYILWPCVYQSLHSLAIIFVRSATSLWSRPAPAAWAANSAPHLARPIFAKLCKNDCAARSCMQRPRLPALGTQGGIDLTCNSASFMNEFISVCSKNCLALSTVSRINPVTSPTCPNQMSFTVASVMGAREPYPLSTSGDQLQPLSCVKLSCHYWRVIL